MMEFKDDFSGLVNLALVLSFNENMSAFRRSLATVISAKLHIHKGVPTQRALDYKRWALQTFCSGGPKSEIRRYLLESLPLGDWRLRDEIPIFVPVGLNFNPDELQEEVIRGPFPVKSETVLLEKWNLLD